MTQLVPARNVGSMVISDSYAACASQVWLEFRPPPVRNGSPKWRDHLPRRTEAAPASPGRETGGRRLIWRVGGGAARDPPPARAARRRPPEHTDAAPPLV